MTGKAQSIGFGFQPGESEHHFVVQLPHAKQESHVYITEHFEWDEHEDKRELEYDLARDSSLLRVLLDRSKWDMIAEEVKAEFNQRLKQNGFRIGRWKRGKNPLSRLLGKELVLLSWAIEDADPGSIPVAIKNWLGLVPEERWWLFTMTNAATGHAMGGKNKGWRKAVRFALTENPVSVEPTNSKKRPNYGLFRLMENDVPFASGQTDNKKSQIKK